jgi:SAM-dependent methyltransferase
VSPQPNSEDVLRFWNEQARANGQSPTASWSDIRLIDLEIATIGAWLQDGNRVLDIGCANGYSTCKYAAAKRITAKGIDFAPSMIEQARQRAAAEGAGLRGTVAFDVGDVLTLKELDGGYDRVIATRVIINLGDWERQARALAHCGRVVAPGGLLLLSEATIGGWQRLNTMRQEWRLPALAMPWFNNYVGEDAVIAALAPAFDLVQLANFASTYYVVTRVIKPLLAATAGVDAADPNMEWNRWAAQLPAAGDYGTQKLFVFRKR